MAWTGIDATFDASEMSVSEAAMICVILRRAARSRAFVRWTESAANFARASLMSLVFSER